MANGDDLEHKLNENKTEKPKAKEYKTDKVIANLTSLTKKPFLDAYNFLKKQIPRKADGLSSIIGGSLLGLYSGIGGGAITYNVLYPTLGSLAIVPTALTGIGLGVLSYFGGAYITKLASTYLIHPFKAIEKIGSSIYTGIKNIARFPFTPYESSKKFLKYIEDIPDKIKNYFKNIKDSVAHPFKGIYEKIFPKKDKDKMP